MGRPIKFYFLPLSGKIIQNENGVMTEITATEAEKLYLDVGDQRQLLYVNLGFKSLIANGFNVAQTIKEYN